MFNHNWYFINFLKYDIILNHYHKELINKLYKSKEEFFVYLKSEELYKVSEIIEVDGNNLKINILMGNFTRRNNLRSRNFNSKYLKEIKIDEISFIKNINYDNEFKEIRNYTLITVGMIWILSIFL